MATAMYAALATISALISVIHIVEDDRLWAVAQILITAAIVFLMVAHT